MILVVDDVPDNIQLLSGLLKGKYKIKVATGGEKALKIAQKAPGPDLILLDVMMPEMDGLEVCRLLKEDPHTMDIPVIFLTVKDDTDTTIQGFSLGAVDFISTPVVPELLKLRINNHLNLKKANDNLKNQVYNLMDKAQFQEKVDNLSN